MRDTGCRSRSAPPPNSGPLHPTYNPYFSPCFFSQNSIFLSQQISQQCFLAGLSAQPNGVSGFAVNCMAEWRTHLQACSGCSCAVDRGWNAKDSCFKNCDVVRLSTLMRLYIHPLKGIFHPSHHKIYSFPAFIHPLYYPLSTVGPTCHFI
jgi:hypothetical protein